MSTFADLSGARFLPAGKSAVMVELADLASVRALYAEVTRRQKAEGLPPLTDVVPAAKTVLFDGVGDMAVLEREIRSWGDLSLPDVQGENGTAVEIPTVYSGPDIEAVARAWGVDPGEVPALHSEAEYEVAFCGFSPGFAYLASNAERTSVPRRQTPRKAVAAGSVALAGEWSAVYPRASPGGWQVIGHTDLEVWDASLGEPALLAPGSKVRFNQVGDRPRRRAAN